MVAILFPCGPAGSVNLGSASSYTAQGVKFNGSPYLEGTAGTDFSTSDGTSVLISFWFKATGTDSFYHSIFEQKPSDGTGLGVFRWIDNTFRIEAKVAGAGSSAFFAISSSTYTTSVNPGWHHVACAYTNLTAPKLYIDGANNLGSEGHLGGTIDFTPANTHVLGSRSGSLTMNADIADFYVAFNQYLDISNATNLQKFRSSGGSPVDLGSTGSIPTGTAPTLYLSGSVASWHVNKGTGGNLFTVQNGPLTAASTNPP